MPSRSLPYAEGLQGRLRVERDRSQEGETVQEEAEMTHPDIDALLEGACFPDAETREAVKARIRELVMALEFYADFANWHNNKSLDATSSNWNGGPASNLLAKLQPLPAPKEPT